MNRKRDDDLIQRLKEVFDAVLPPVPEGDYPEEALPLGTFVRPKRINRLGVITDAFYGELDKDNNKIIIYTILLLPQARAISGIPGIPKQTDQYYLTNEYEYEITAYLMIGPADLSKLTANLGGGLL
jgi:hypothetical protein